MLLDLLIDDNVIAFSDSLVWRFVSLFSFLSSTVFVALDRCEWAISRARDTLNEALLTTTTKTD